MSATLLASPGANHTSSLTVPNTQNTAPIIDYRCLYTHDLRRKQKRWQDGVLRYHTFNKRVMVYDVPRNYIGDTHWRDSEPVQDGDEFELDRGVLIQVGELLGSVQQDLSELLEKRKKAPEVQTRDDSLPKQSAVNLARPHVSQPTQLIRPKSLNAVLGTPKGPVGRAAVQVRSPYEQRMEARPLASENDISAKRQRVETSAEKRLAPPSHRVAVGGPPQSCKEKSVSEKPKERPTLIPRTGAQRIGLANEGTIISRTGKSMGIANTATRPENTRNQKRRNLEDEPILVGSSQEELTPVANVPKETHVTRRIRTSENEPPHRTSAPEKQTTAKRPKTQHHTKGRIADGDEGLNADFDASGQRKAQVRLQMVSKKPRKKLMYRDLLPEEAPKEREREREDHGECSKRTLTSLHQEQQDSIEARLNRYQGREVRTSSAEKILGPITSKPQQKSTDRRIEKPQRRDARRPTPPMEQKSKRIPRPKPTLHDTNLALAKMDELLFSRTHSVQNPPASPRASPNNTIRPEDASSAEEASLFVSQRQHTPPPNNPHPSESRTQIPSSPGFQTQHPKPNKPNTENTTHQQKARSPDPIVNNSLQNQDQDPNPNLDEAIIIESSQPRQPDEPLPIPIPPNSKPPNPPASNPPVQVIPSAPPPSAPPYSQTPNADPPPEEPLQLKAKPLPSFKQPTRRSPLKKAISDTSSMRPPPPAPTITAIAPAAQTGRRGGGDGGSARERVAEAWSREAWDLFGCGKDGVACGFGEFVEKAGLG